MLELVFQNLDIQLKHARSADEAIRIYGEGSVDVILSDIKMPGKTGLELAGKIKGMDPEAVILLMTANNSRDQVIQALRLGVYDFVEKPYREQELCEMILRAMKQREKQLALAQAPTQLAAQEKELEDLRKWKQSHSNREDEIAREHMVQREQVLQKRELELEVKEGALQTMETVLRERLQSIKKIQNTRPPITVQGMSPEVQSQMEKLKMELEARKQALEEMEASLNERESFLQQSEETLFEKGQTLQEWETELEQLKDDLNKQKDQSPSVRDDQILIDGDQLKELEAMKHSLAEREEAVSTQERAIKKREMALRRAELLVKAREQFLEQSENILFGEETGD